MVNEAAVDHTGGNWNVAMNFDKVLKLFNFAETLIQNFGLNALKSVQQIMFADLDHFNVSTLILHLFKTIVVQRDQTVISLTSSSQSPMKIGKVFQKVSQAQNRADLSQLEHNFSAHYLEESCLQPIMKTLEVLTSSKMYQYLETADRLKLQ